MAYDDEVRPDTFAALSPVRDAGVREVTARDALDRAPVDRAPVDRAPVGRAARGRGRAAIVDRLISEARTPASRGQPRRVSGGEPAASVPEMDREVAEAALRGLQAPRKTLPPSLFYDEEGCRLFYEITKLPEYYLTRAEFRLLDTTAPEVASLLPAGSTLVEYGASDETKAEMLLRQPSDDERPSAPGVFSTYIPIDVAAPALRAMRERLAIRRPALTVRPVAADFLRPIVLPERDGERGIMGFFPGSTIGNLEPEAAVGFLRRARATLGRDARLLLGFDTCRDPARLIPAYDDAQRVTAGFNRNLLVRLNHEAGATFPLDDPDAFAHRAVWNAAESRIEMHLVSGAARTVTVAGQPIRFGRDETIHTENSYKYAPERMLAMIEAGGWSRVKVWSDPDNLFALWLLG